MKKIQVVILTRDRLSYFVDALESVLRQKTNEDFEVVISDNSIGDETFHYILNNHPNLKYVRRIPPMDSDDHFQKVFMEAECQYLVLFHDDDVMKSDYLDKMSSILDSNLTISAVACNASLIIKDVLHNNLSFQSESNEVSIIKNGKELIDFYFGNKEVEQSMPFPSYMYRKFHMDESFFKIPYGGKYRDVIILAMMADKAPLAWCKSIGMFYRVHGKNDSSSYSIVDRISLLRFLVKRRYCNKESNDYRNIRFNFWRIWFFQNSKNKNRTYFIVRKFIILHAIKLVLTNPKMIYIFVCRYWFNQKIKRAYAAN